MKTLFLYILISLCSISYFSQDTTSQFHLGVCDKHGFCIPSISGLPRPKGIELNYTRAIKYDISTTTNNSTANYSGVIDRNRRAEVKLNFPVILKPGLKLLIGANYEIEEFRFENPTELNNDFYRDLENKPLRSLGSKLILIKPFKGDKYLVVKSNYRLSGDFTKRAYYQHQRISAAVIYGKKVNANKTWGLGLNYSYTFGRQIILPVFAISKKINSKLSIESLLPVNLRIRYMFNRKNILNLFVNLEGDKYFLNFDNLPENELYLEKSEIIFSAIFEKEIYDFIWFKASAGFRSNINFNLSDSESFPNRSIPQINNTLGDSFRYSVGIFIVPPNKWLK